MQEWKDLFIQVPILALCSGLVLFVYIEFKKELRYRISEFKALYEKQLDDQRKNFDRLEEILRSRISYLEEMVSDLAIKKNVKKIDGLER